MTNELTVGLSPTAPGLEWDGVIGSLPAGNLSQSSGWAAFQRLRGHDARHLEARRSSDLVGGATLVIRRLPMGRAMGHVARGPVGTDSEVVEAIVTELVAVSASERLDPLIVDPADEAASSALSRAGFVRSKIGITLPATVVVDVDQEDDALLAGMKSKTRYNIRKGVKSGVVVRRGDKTDADVFERLMTDTGRRQGFVADGASYVTRVFEALPTDDVALFVAEHDGVELAAILVAAFGNRVTYKRGGWSGRSGSLHPNEVLHWSAMRWARDTGRREYDFDGVDPGDIEGEGSTRTVSHFKVGFGGRRVDLPPTLVRFRNPVLRVAHDRIGPKAMRAAKRAVRRIQVAS